ncbi:hypothetical protein KEM55_003380, partial [Ascosphaera atra]
MADLSPSKGDEAFLSQDMFVSQAPFPGNLNDLPGFDTASPGRRADDSAVPSTSTAKRNNDDIDDDTFAKRPRLTSDVTGAELYDQIDNFFSYNGDNDRTPGAAGDGDDGIDALRGRIGVPHDDQEAERTINLLSETNRDDEDGPTGRERPTRHEAEIEPAQISILES